MEFRCRVASPTGEIVMADVSFGVPVKAENAEQWLVAKSTFVEFPNLWTGSSLTELNRISDANPQQKDVAWTPGARLIALHPGTGAALSFARACVSLPSTGRTIARRRENLKRLVHNYGLPKREPMDWSNPFALFSSLAQIDIVHVPYKGVHPAMIDVIAGQIHMLYSTILQSQPHIKAGKLRPLAVTTAKRSRAAPELPTMQEAGDKGYEVADGTA